MENDHPQIAIEPKSKGDLEKMGMGLSKLAQEDPSFNFSRDEETGQTVSGRVLERLGAFWAQSMHGAMPGPCTDGPGD